VVVNHYCMARGVYSAGVREEPDTRADGTADVPTTAELIDALQTTVGRVRAHFAATTAQVGVTPAQAKALRQLSEPLTLKDLSAQLEADVSNTSNTVDRLEAQGLIRKEAHLTDRRARLLTLTDDGRRVRQALQEATFARVPALDRLDDSQRRELYELLRIANSP